METESSSLYFQMIFRSEKPNLRKLGERVTSYLEVIPEDALVEIVQSDAGKGNQMSTKSFSKRMPPPLVAYVTPHAISVHSNVNDTLAK